MPAAVSSLTTTAVSIAASTPLPNSDDSDLFESPAESPSQLEENSLHEISKPPKLQLDEDDEISAVQHAPDGSQERFIVEEVMDDFDEEKEDTHRSVEQSVDDLEDKEVPSEATIPTSKAPSPPLKGLMEKLARDSISSMVSLRVTPLKPQSSDAKPSPSVQQQTVSSFSPQVEPTRLFSPIPLLSELVETKKEKLMKSLEEVKKRHTTAIMHHKDYEKQGYFSPTMVKHTDGEISTTSSTLHGTQYSFSPPTEMKVDQTTTKSHTSDIDAASFVFSPPLTRSAARRMKEKESDKLVPFSEYGSTRKKGRGR